MKRLNYFLFCIVALGMLFFQSCSREAYVGNEETPYSNEGKLSFVLPIGKNAPVTYATDIVGLSDEYKLENLYIFWFANEGSGDFKYIKTFAYGHTNTNFHVDPMTIDSTTTAPQTIATVDIGESDKPSRFYFIANVNASTPVQLDASFLNSNTKSNDFEDLLYSELLATEEIQDLNGSGNLISLKKIQTPLPMSVDASSGQGNGKGYVQVNDMQTTKTVDNVNMKRRVARFDILNNEDYSNFHITRVLVSRAQKAGWLKDTDFTGSGEPWDPTTTASMVVDASHANGTRNAAQVDTLAYDNTDEHNVFVIRDANGDSHADDIFDDFQGAHTRDSIEVNPAVFYLWPTILKRNWDDTTTPGIEVAVTDGTEIVIEGAFKGGVTKLYKLHLTANQKIEANYIYKIKVVRLTSSSIDFQLTVENWKEDVQIGTNPVGTDLDWTKVSFEAPGQAIITDLSAVTPTYTYSSASPVTIKIVSYGTNLDAQNKGVVVVTPSPVGAKDAAYLQRDWVATSAAANIDVQTITTYGSTAGYKTTHTITLPPTDAPLETIWEIRNAAKDADVRFIKLKSDNFAKTGYAPLTFTYKDVNNADKTILWAPLNLGATRMDASPSGIGSGDTRVQFVGNLYQFGRNVPFAPTGSVDKVAGPVAKEYADTTTRFITSSTDWINPSITPRWQDASSTPLPGWRLPTREEYKKLFASGASSATGSFIKVVNAGTSFYFPISPWRTGSTGDPNGTVGFQWAADMNGNNKAYMYRTDAADAEQNYGCANAAHLRLVRDVPPANP